MHDDGITCPQRAWLPGGVIAKRDDHILRTCLKRLPAFGVLALHGDLENFHGFEGHGVDVAGGVTARARDDKAICSELASDGFRHLRSARVARANKGHSNRQDHEQIL